MSFTDWLDADAGMRIVAEFERPAAVIIKHTNPCGFVDAEDVCHAYELAFDCDPRAAYGGVVAVNRPVGKDLARLLAKTFLNVLVAPTVAADVAAELRESLRLLDRPSAPGELDVRSIDGGLLLQAHDRLTSPRDRAGVMTRLQPSEEQWHQLLTAWKVARHVKSNAVVIGRRGHPARRKRRGPRCRHLCRPVGSLNGQHRRPPLPALNVNRLPGAGAAGFVEEEKPGEEGGRVLLVAHCGRPCGARLG